MIGPCIYVDQKLMVSAGKAPTLDELKSETEPDKISLDKVIANAGSLSGPKPYFLKDRIYEWQSEFRFVWETNKNVTSHLDIAAPNLRQYCKF